MKFLKSFLCFTIILTLLCGCTAIKNIDSEETTVSTSKSETTTSSTASTETSSETSVSSEASSAESESSAVPAVKTDVPRSFGTVREIIRSMSLEEKVGQLFMVFPETLSGVDTYVGLNDGAGKAAVTYVSGDIKAAIKKYHIGGVVMFAQNVISPSQITAFNSALQSSSDIPLFISVDEEGGSVARLGRNKNFSLPTYKSAAAVGASGRYSDAYNMGASIGGYLKRYGFNMDFAPVADVNSNPNNPVIGNRSFSPDPATAARLSGAAAKGLRDKGIMPTFKHFPGHGDTAEDSHKSLAVNNHNLERLMNDDWLPYINNDLSGCAVMVGHIALPNVTGVMRSAAVDWNIVTGYLRNRLGFNGLIVTDSMKMRGVTDYYETGAASVMAINAGCDIVLMPQNFVKSYNAVLEAVRNGAISQERLNRSLTRILEAKKQYGIIK